MLYHFLAPLADETGLFNLFHDLTFRTCGAVLTGLLFAFICGPPMIRWLKRRQSQGQPIRTDGPERHLLAKKGTPTMGGLMIILGIGLATVLWADLGNGFIWVASFVTLGYGVIGFIDDYLKVTRHHSGGLPCLVKFLCQCILGTIAASLIIHFTQSTDVVATGLALPFLKSVIFDLGMFYCVFATIVMVGASNAVNLTDGLDGLATVPVLISAGVFMLIAYLSGHVGFATYVQIHHVPGAGELAVFCGALIGSGLGFLWFNAPPAMVFMGDTGSLAMGGALGTVSIITKHELVLAVVGGLFVLEAVSVIVQVVAFRLTGHRVFRMAPLHHHFERKGWPESTIVIRFWIIATILAIAGLSTLKLR